MKKKEVKKIKFLKTNRGLLIISWLMAFLLWFIVKMSHNYTHSENIDILYNIPLSKSMLNVPPNTMITEFSSSGWHLLTLGINNQKKSIQIDLSNKNSQAFGSGDLVNYLKNSDFTQNLIINKVNINLIQIELEDKATKKVPILVYSTPNIKPGFVLIKEFTCNPDSVLLSGPYSILEDIDYVEPNFDDIPSLTASESLELMLFNPFDKTVNFSVSKTTVTTNIEQLIEKSMFFPIVLKGATDSIEIFPSVVKAVFNIPRVYFNDVKSFDFKVEANFKNRSDKFIPLELLHKPDFIDDIKFDTDSVEYIKVQYSSDTIN